MTEPRREHWQCRRLSGVVGICSSDGSALHVTHRPVDAAAVPPGRFSFAVPGAGGATLWQDSRFWQLSADDLVLVDLGRPYDYRGRVGALSVVVVDGAALGLTAGEARVLAPLLRASTLRDLVRDHVRALADLLLTVADTARLDDLGAATVQLLGALLVSCFADGER